MDSIFVLGMVTVVLPFAIFTVLSLLSNGTNKYH